MISIPLCRPVFLFGVVHPIAGQQLKAFGCPLALLGPTLGDDNGRRLQRKHLVGLTISVWVGPCIVIRLLAFPWTRWGRGPAPRGLRWWAEGGHLWLRRWLLPLRVPRAPCPRVEVDLHWFGTRPCWFCRRPEPGCLGLWLRVWPARMGVLWAPRPRIEIYIHGDWPGNFWFHLYGRFIHLHRLRVEHGLGARISPINIHGVVARGPR